MAFFTREEIIDCSKLVYIFFFNVRRVKVSSSELISCHDELDIQKA